MQTAILTLHVIVCVILVVLVLLQSGREGMGVIFGGGGNSVFGNAGAGGILSKLTTFLAVIFICTSLGYNIMTSSTNKEVESVLDVQFEEVPAAPAQAPAAVSAPAAPAVPAETAPAPETAVAPAAAPAETAPAPAETVVPAETVPAPEAAVAPAAAPAPAEAAVPAEAAK